jgi:hypothetical protein
MKMMVVKGADGILMMILQGLATVSASGEAAG